MPEAFTIKGMTGFGRAAAECDGVRVEVEIKGVNHRSLDMKMRLPAEVSALEPDLRGRLQRVVARGRIDVAVSLASARPPTYRIEVNRALVAEFLKATAALKKEFALKGALGIETVAGLPGALSILTDASTDGGPGPALLAKAFEQALFGFDAMRGQEGTRLARDVLTRLQAIEEGVDRIEAEARGLPEAFAARLRERVAALVQERGLDDMRLAQEVALMADRVDLTEEVVRLRGYLQQSRALLERPDGPVGKTLDFVMQEMNREANTISSKAERLSICQAALQIKSEVEKIREQVQNLE